ncbi:hypothetical protein [Amycolatopsis sp. CA-230715]|uniref:hypothetical protein n=1 Tax=Amycolatopsis sp. CA-230715 TaxID=2745196 RepID=UPI001C015F3F|nr:hypothetical protein [Amycolatopsis sp. CA-230715]QWF84257.1 hypothetical protein HUW46_07706 [Amycolatopsis sp. CA-230715]
MGTAEGPRADAVLTAWAPAGKGRIVVVLGQGVVIHKAIVSGKAGAIGIAQGVGLGAGVALGVAGAAIVGAARANEIYGSPFIEKVLRNGVDGLLASPRKVLVRWDRIVSAEYRKLALGRGRMIIRTGDGEHVLKFLQNTYVAGNPSAVFAHFLADRFTGPRFAD